MKLAQLELMRFLILLPAAQSADFELCLLVPIRPRESWNEFLLLNRRAVVHSQMMSTIFFVAYKWHGRAWAGHYSWILFELFSRIFLVAPSKHRYCLIARIFLQYKYQI